MYELKISKIDFLKTVKNINQEICQQKQTKSKCLLTVLNWDRNLRNIFMSVAPHPSHYLHICNTDKIHFSWTL